MTVLSDPAVEVVAPSFYSIPPRDGALVRAVEGVAERVGRTLDPTQRFAVDVLTSSWRDGRPSSIETAIVAPRQNLKTYVLELITLTRLLRPGGDRLAVWSAHERGTALETFKTFCDLADEYRWLGDQMLPPSRATGREEIRFKNGRRLKFKARIKTGGRGLAGDLVILDEAFALQPEHMGSLMPILSTKAKGQILYGSSAPHSSSAVLHKVVQRGRSHGMAYCEWSAPGSLAAPGCASPECTHEAGVKIGDDYRPVVAGCVLDDPAMWLRANSAATHGRISMNYLQSERAALTVEEFARERLGWGESPAQPNAPFTATEWDACARPDLAGAAPAVHDETFAVDLAWDRRHGSIAVASRMADGTPLVELVEHVSGIDTLIERAGQIAARNPNSRWVASGAVESIARDLRQVGVSPKLLSTRELEAAHGRLQDAVKQRAVAHLGDESLSLALVGAARRDSETGWTFTRRKSDVDISPLYAVLEALWALPPDYDLLDTAR